MTTRKEIIQQAQAWVGKNEKDGSFKVIIDTYNTQTKLPRGYKMRYTDEWCATFISSLAIMCNATDIIPTECSCTKMIEKHKALGTWIEADNYKPATGDLLFYYWSDNGKGDCTSGASHIGIVEKVEGNKITVIEGNKGEAVARRTITVDARYIRGYAVPKYKAEAQPQKAEVKVMVEMKQLSKGSKGAQVKTLQRLLNATGYNCGNVDGDFGAKTDAAVRAYQKAKGLGVDGVVGAKTWAALLN